MLNRHGKIVSKRKSLAATGANNLGQWLRKKGDTFEGKPKGFKAEEQKPKPKKQAPPKKPVPKPKPVAKKVAPKKAPPPKPKKLKVIPKKMHVLKKKASEAAKQQQAAARKRPAAKPKMIDVIDLSSPKKPAKKKKLSFLERLKLKGLA